MELMFWPLQGDPRLVAMPDAAFRNNSDKSSQRAMVIFMAEPRREKSKNTKGSLICFESTKIKRTTLSTTVAELYALMKCYGTCQMLRGLIKDITGLSSEIHMRADANNLVTTASTTHVPEQQETIHMIQMLRKEACSGSVADLSHIRTQWCLADCLTKKSANPQNLFDAVRQGVLKEVDAHPPFRSLLEHKAYLRSWLPTVCSHVDFRHDVFLLGDTLRDSWLFFEFVPAAQEAVSRGSYCFFNMSSSSRWNRISAAESSTQAQSRSRGQEQHDSTNDDEVRRRTSDGYALRRSEEIPDNQFRTPDRLPREDHLAFSNGYRRQTDWFYAREDLRQKRSRNLHSVLGPHNMADVDKQEMLMDAVSSILYWGTRYGEFDDSLRWIAEFLKYLCVFTTQEEEDWFSGRCSEFNVDMTGPPRNSYYLGCSKSLSGVLRHCRNKTLFTDTGSMNISDLFDQMQEHNPKQYNMKGSDLAAMLLSNPKQRFFVEIHMQWKWYPYSPAATYSFDVRIGACQGHSNQVVDPNVAHHPLTYDEAVSLGWIFHVTDYWNLESIPRYGLKTNVKGSGKGGRDAVHFHVSQ